MQPFQTAHQSCGPLVQSRLDGREKLKTPGHVVYGVQIFLPMIDSLSKRREILDVWSWHGQRGKAAVIWSEPERAGRGSKGCRGEEHGR
eukprot:384656-Rhodomonas_salina.1